MLYAAGSGDADAVQGLLRQGMSPDSANAEGTTPLILAASKGHNVSSLRARVVSGVLLRMCKLVAKDPCQTLVQTLPALFVALFVQDAVLAPLFNGAGLRLPNPYMSLTMPLANASHPPKKTSKPPPGRRARAAVQRRRPVKVRRRRPQPPAARVPGARSPHALARVFSQQELKGGRRGFLGVVAGCARGADLAGPFPDASDRSRPASNPSALDHRQGNHGGVLDILLRHGAKLGMEPVMLAAYLCKVCSVVYCIVDVVCCMVLLWPMQWVVCVLHQAWSR